MGVSVVCGVWYVVCGVWCVVCGVWCVVWCVAPVLLLCLGNMREGNTAQAKGRCGGDWKDGQGSVMGEAEGRGPDP